MGLNKWDFSKSVFSRKDLENHSLHHAVERGDVDSLQRLIDTDIRQCITLVDSVNARDGLLKGTPLHVAAEEGNLKVAKFLLINEADVMAKDKHGCEPLHLAAHRGHSDLILLFIVKGALVNNRNFLGDTALHYAANKGHNEAVKCLIRNGSVVDARNSKGWTPLHLAVVSAHFETVRILVSEGANLNSRDSNGNTPLHLASECNNIGMVDYLLKKGAKASVENKALQIPGELCSRTVIKEILGWRPSQSRYHQNRRRRSSNSSASSTSGDEGNDRRSSGLHEKKRLMKPEPLENKHLSKVKSLGLPVNSPESFQERMKRKTREMRMNQKIVLKKDEGGRNKLQWNKKFLKRYGLMSKNLFAP